MTVYCDVDYCKYYKDGECDAESIEISEDFTACGFFILCATFEEKKGE